MALQTTDLPFITKVLMVLPRGQGVKAADALVVFQS